MTHSGFEYLSHALWIPAFAGMTENASGVTENAAGMTDVSGVCDVSYAQVSAGDKLRYHAVTAESVTCTVN